MSRMAKRRRSRRRGLQVGVTVRLLVVANVLLGAALWVTAGPGVVLLAIVVALTFGVLASGRRRLHRRKT